MPFVARKGPLAAVRGRFGDRVLFAPGSSPQNANERQVEECSDERGVEGTRHVTFRQRRGARVLQPPWPLPGLASSCPRSAVICSRRLGSENFHINFKEVLHHVTGI